MSAVMIVSNTSRASGGKKKTSRINDLGASQDTLHTHTHNHRLAP